MVYGLTTPADLASFAGGYRDNRLLYGLFRLFNGLLRYPLVFLSIFYFYVRFSKLGADIFVSNNGGYPGGDYNRSATLAAALVRKMKVFHIVHNMALEPIPVFRPMEFLYDFLIDHASTLICVSKATDERLKKVRNIKQEITCIHNGLEVRPVKTYGENAAVKILNVGSLEGRKNQILLIQALGRLAARGITGFAAYFVGKEAEDGYWEMMQEYARDFQFQECLFFEGFQEDPGPYYEACDLFVLSSNVEGLPVVILEAMRVGMPVITTDAGGAREEVVDGVSGFVVPPGDDQALAEKLSWFLRHPERLEEMGRQGYRVFLERFALGRMTDAYAELFGLKVPGPDRQSGLVFGR